ncbi:uncharacterized protein [Nicotiana tomentosiformis]|uniref:uncharacterized protein n=1 Tax=Nicotiana tomentosiformis TaxID=4098 RepID=UPI00388C9FC6
MAVNKWSQYLIIRPFVVKTNQKALKYFEIFRGVTQYDFKIEYKKVKENKAVNALSRLPLVGLTVMTLTAMKTDLLDRIVKSWETDIELRSLIQSLKEGRGDSKGYTFIHEKLRRHKYDNAPYHGLQQPLKVLVAAWTSISMDFIEGLLKSKGKSVIWVEVDRLTKYAHFTGYISPLLDSGYCYDGTNLRA